MYFYFILFLFLKFWKLLFYIQRAVLFPPKDDVLDEPSKEVRLVQLNEADVLRILAETLAAHIEAVFPDQTVPVWADLARARILAKFSRMAPGELLVTHVAFSAARRQKGGVFFSSVFQDHLYLFSVCIFCLFFYWFVRLSSQFLWALNVIRKIDVFLAISYKKFPYRIESLHTGRKRLIVW